MAITHFALIANVLLKVAHFKINDPSWSNKLMCPGDVSLGGRLYCSLIVWALLIDLVLPFFREFVIFFVATPVFILFQTSLVLFSTWAFYWFGWTLLWDFLSSTSKYFVGYVITAVERMNSDSTRAHQMSIVVVPKFNFTQFLQSIVKYRITSLKYSWIRFSRNVTG